MKNEVVKGFDKLALRGGIGCFIFLAIASFIAAGLGGGGLAVFIGVCFIFGAIISFLWYRKI